MIRQAIHGSAVFPTCRMHRFFVAIKQKIMKRFLEKYWPIVLAYLWNIYLTILFLIFSSCSRIQYVPVNTISTDSIYITKYKADSTYLKDSIYISISQKADTVYRTEYKYRIHYRDRWRVDTMVCERVDSVQVPYPVEKKLTRWQQWKQDVGGWSTAIIIITLIIVVGMRVYKLIK